MLHYFVDSNAPGGKSCLPSNLAPCASTLSLSGYPRPARETLLYGIAGLAQDAGLSFEMIHHPLDDSPQGMIFPKTKKACFFYDTYDSRLPNYVNYLGSPDLEDLQKALESARESLFKARAFHDQQEKIYLSQMNFKAADEAAQRTIQSIFPSQQEESTGGEVHRFFGTAGFRGSTDHIEELTEGLARRIFLKGRPGTGKSTFLKKIANEAQRRGYFTERYHCSLDYKSLDLVIVRELSVSVLDSTPPHEYFPSRPGDEIVDLYLECVAPGTDQAFEKELSQLHSAYRELVNTAKGFFGQAKEAADRFEAALPSADPKALARLEKELFRQLSA